MANVTVESYNNFRGGQNHFQGGKMPPRVSIKEENVSHKKKQKNTIAIIFLPPPLHFNNKSKFCQIFLFALIT